MPGTEKTRVIIALAENKPGVLSHLLNLFRRRRFNIESITAGYTETPGISRITVTTFGDERTLDQIVKQMYKILEIVKVCDATEEKALIRELALIKITTTPQTRNEIVQIVDIFRGKIVDIAQNSLTIEITGSEEKINSLVELVKKFGIKELARTGHLAMLRGGVNVKAEEASL